MIGEPVSWIIDRSLHSNLSIDWSEVAEKLENIERNYVELLTRVTHKFTKYRWIKLQIIEKLKTENNTL